MMTSRESLSTAENCAAEATGGGVGAEVDERAGASCLTSGGRLAFWPSDPVDRRLLAVEAVFLFFTALSPEESLP